MVIEIRFFNCYQIYDQLFCCDLVRIFLVIGSVNVKSLPPPLLSSSVSISVNITGTYLAAFFVLGQNCRSFFSMDNLFDKMHERVGFVFIIIIFSMNGFELTIITGNLCGFSFSFFRNMIYIVNNSRNMKHFSL